MTSKPIEDAIVIEFVTRSALVDLIAEARSLDPSALAWVLEFSAVQLSNDEDRVWVRIRRTHYEYILAGMEHVAEHLAPALEAEILIEADEIIEEHAAVIGNSFR